MPNEFHYLDQPSLKVSENSDIRLGRRKGRPAIDREHTNPGDEMKALKRRKGGRQDDFNFIDIHY